MNVSQSRGDVLTEYQRGYLDGYAAYEREMIASLEKRCPDQLAKMRRAQALMEALGVTEDEAIRMANNEERDE